MFWEVIAIISLSMALVFGGLDVFIRIMDMRDRNKNGLREYLKRNSQRLKK